MTDKDDDGSIIDRLISRLYLKPSPTPYPHTFKPFETLTVKSTS